MEPLLDAAEMKSMTTGEKSRHAVPQVVFQANGAPIDGDVHVNAQIPNCLLRRRLHALGGLQQLHHSAVVLLHVLKAIEGRIVRQRLAVARRLINIVDKVPKRVNHVPLHVMCFVLLVDRCNQFLLPSFSRFSSFLPNSCRTRGIRFFLHRSRFWT